jgi:predicted transposase YdaD
MAKTFDAVTRSLLERHPTDWLNFLGLIHDEPARVVNSDLSTVTAEADKVIRVEGPVPWLVHVELQTRFDKTLPRRLLPYNTLLNLRHDLPVHSVAVLLQAQADGEELDGVLRLRSPDERCSLEFRYHVVRVWELPTEVLLSGGRGVLPLAPITASTEEGVPLIIEELKQRVDPAASSGEDREFWMATVLMTGLRFPWDKIEDWFRGITAMRQSSAYEHFVSEGRALGVKEGIKEGSLLEARKLILRIGQRSFGPPDSTIQARIESIADLESLEQLLEKLLSSTGWSDLLADL